MREAFKFPFENMDEPKGALRIFVKLAPAFEVVVRLGGICETDASSGLGSRKLFQPAS